MRFAGFLLLAAGALSPMPALAGDGNAAKTDLSDPASLIGKRLEGIGWQSPFHRVDFLRR
jgi:hypothetical protein